MFSRVALSRVSSFLIFPSLLVSQLMNLRLRSVYPSVRVKLPSDPFRAVDIHLGPQPSPSTRTPRSLSSKRAYRQLHPFQLTVKNVRPLPRRRGESRTTDDAVLVPPVRLGFPPALLPLDTSLDSTLASLGIKSGDSIIVAESSEPTPAVSAPPVRVVTNASSAPAASTVKPTSGAVTYEEVDGGYLVLRVSIILENEMHPSDMSPQVVPDDNS